MAKTTPTISFTSDLYIILTKQSLCIQDTYMHSMYKCGTNTTHLTQKVQLLLFFILTSRLLQCLHPACMYTLPNPSQSIFRVLLYWLKFFQFKQPTKCMSQPSVVPTRLYTNCRNNQVHQRCHSLLTMKGKKYTWVCGMFSATYITHTEPNR